MVRKIACHEPNWCIDGRWLWKHSSTHGEYPNTQMTEAVARTTNEPSALSELHCLCRDNRLYDVERWIQAGRPLQLAEGTTVRRRRATSALEITLVGGNQALVLLLLCNGYDPNLESRCPLDLALRSRRWDLLDLLLELGADPRRVSLGDLFDSYNSELMERFRTLGIDLSANHELAKALSYHTSNKPLFGFAKRRREHDPGIQRELNIALVHHAGKGNEKGVHLCLWAGADAHAPAPSLRFPSSTDREGDESDDSERFLGFTAIDEACSAGDARIARAAWPRPVQRRFRRALPHSGLGSCDRTVGSHGSSEDYRGGYLLSGLPDSTAFRSPTRYSSTPF